MSPQSVNAAIGDVTEFSCEGFGDFIIWKVNGAPVDNRPGFLIHPTEFNNETMLRTVKLTVDTSNITNGTTITCIAVKLQSAVHVPSEAPSDSAVILLQGALPFQGCMKGGVGVFLDSSIF